MLTKSQISKVARLNAQVCELGGGDRLCHGGRSRLFDRRIESESESVFELPDGGPGFTIEMVNVKVLPGKCRSFHL